MDGGAIRYLGWLIPPCCRATAYHPMNARTCIIRNHTKLLGRSVRYETLKDRTRWLLSLLVLCCFLMLYMFLKNIIRGVFTCIADVEAAGKVISILPSRDGKVYEIRRTEMGTFVTPTANDSTHETINIFSV